MGKIIIIVKIFIIVCKCSPDCRRTEWRMLLQVCEGGVGGFCPGRMAACTAGWWMTPCLPCLGWLRQWQQHWSSRFSGPLLCGIRRSLGRRRSCAVRAEMLLSCDEGEGGWQRDFLGSHSPACGGRCCLNGFCLGVVIGSDGSLSGCKNSVFLITTCSVTHCLVVFLLPSRKVCLFPGHVLKWWFVSRRAFFASLLFFLTKQYSIGAKACFASWPFDEMLRILPGKKFSGSLPAPWS